MNFDKKLVAPDADQGDQFGYAVAISGTTALVGSWLDDDGGSGSGSAYLFDTTTGGLISKLTAPDAAGGDRFGWSVAISGTTALVGSHLDDDDGTNSGSAYLFDTTTGGLIRKLTAPDAALGDQFGWSVAVSGTTALVGSYRDADNGGSSGSAYLFDTTTGGLLHKLVAPDGAGIDFFGWSVALSGTTALVGSVGDDDNGTDSGSAYLFDTTTGGLISKLTAPDGAPGDEFGWSVAVSGATALVGSHRDGDNGSDSGSAYLFDASTGGLITKLIAPDGAAGDQFGHSVALSGTTVLVGSRLDDDNGMDAGSAYLFDTATGGLISKITAPDGAAHDEFGHSVAMNGTSALVGSRLDDDNGLLSSGSAYLFTQGSQVVIPGDANADGAVDLLDFDILAQNFGLATAGGASAGDFNGDGAVDLLDFDVLAQNFGAGSPATLPGVAPEPASLAMLGLAGTLLLRGRRRGGWA
ncbi:MAG: dockerin type I domain-containing protein [Planctomycetota bacterium]